MSVSDDNSDSSLVNEGSDDGLLETRTSDGVIESRTDRVQPGLKPGYVIKSRYEILRRLGEGGFGAVFLAHDKDLDRDVAIKCSIRLRREVAEQVRAEAKAIAALNHSGIISIYDLMRHDDDNLLIVMEYVPGMTLRSLMNHKSLTTTTAADIAAQIAEALIHAHSRKLIHRDLKPSNLLIDANQHVRLLDFGLAIGQFPETLTVAVGGTPGYMSPEQARAETHRIDGRTDVWALGVVLYEMLTQEAPFQGRTAKSKLENTVRREPPPPRQLNALISPELDRICMKCLCKRMAGRYASAADVAIDLRAWLTSSCGSDDASQIPAVAVESPSSISSAARSSSKGSLAILTKGLRPFSEDEAESYWDLIPGPRDRNGTPESIRFWKQWAESDDSDSDAPVGVLYGPSGSGKSSFVRAGLLGKLDDSVCSVYVECRPGDLGGRIVRIISAKLESESTGSSLRDLLTHFRSDDDINREVRKLLVVLDQFEAWAHCASLQERQNLADALRQCDGVRIRAMVVVRDDYWMGVTELLSWLELPLQEGRNASSVELLDKPQAAVVLETLGRAYGTLHEEPEPLNSEQVRFIEQSVEELAVGGRVICVHLVMFAQMIRLQDWTPKLLRESGGVAGSCVTFMQELFDTTAASAPPSYRRIAAAVADVLRELMPPADQSVHAYRRTKSELAEALNNTKHAHLLDDTLKVLSDDVKIITVATDEPLESDSPDRSTSYQISHDFLVEPLRAWVNVAQKSSWRGRASARLTEMSRMWAKRPQTSFLPSMTEYVAIQLSTQSRLCSDHEKAYLRAARRLHAGRASVAAVALSAFVVMTLLMLKQRNSAQLAVQRQVSSQVDLLLNGPAKDMQQHIADLQANSLVAENLVEPWTNSVDPQFKLRARLFTQSLHPKSFAGIESGIEGAPVELFPAILRAAESSADATSILDRQFDQASSSPRLRSRAAILLLYLGQPAKLRTLLRFTDDASEQSAAITQACTWRGKPDPWVSLIASESDRAVRYGAGLVLGSYPPESLAAVADQIPVASLLESPDPTAHSLGEWLAVHLKQEVDLQAIAPPTSANWIRTPSGIPMARLEAGNFRYVANPINPESVTEKTIEKPFYLAAAPITRALFNEFLAEVKTLPSGNPTEELYRNVQLAKDLDPTMPAMGFDSQHAFALCNWLSEKDGLTACYRWKTKTEVTTFKGLEGAAKAAFSHRDWETIEQADGYNLPSARQFIYAVRCGVTRGNSWEPIKPVFASARPNADARLETPQIARVLMPNRWGLFVLDSRVGTWTYGNGFPPGTASIDDDRILSVPRISSLPAAAHSIFLAKKAK